MVNRQIYCFAAGIISVCLSVILLQRITLQVDMKKSLYVIQSDSPRLVYQYDRKNTAVCDLATLSKVYYGMQADDFKVLWLKESEDAVDILMEKDGVRYRLYYKQDGALTSIADTYEKSSVPLSYINE